MTDIATTDEFLQLIDAPDVRIVDARPTAAFNGWRFGDETRTGHVRGAIACPVTWLELADETRLRSMLLAGPITPAHRVVVYGEDAHDAGRLAKQLETLGYREVYRFGGGFAALAADERVVVDRLARYDRLVYPQWLCDLVEGRPVERRPDRDPVLLHANFGVPEEYAEGHIPGAVFLDTNVLESSETWNRRSPAELDAAMRALGITFGTPVILYGRDSAADPEEQVPGKRIGQIAATRAAVILTYAGVGDVRVLDGGYNAWVAAGFDVEEELRLPEPVEAFGAAIPARPDVIVDFEEAEDLVADPQGVLVSIRSWAEHVGETSGYSYIDETGDIPGAVWGNCGDSAYDMQHYRSIDNTMKSYPEIAADWSDAGITPEKRVAFYCGTGWRASEAWFYAYLMGWPQVALYDGGWFEWKNRMLQDD